MTKMSAALRKIVEAEMPFAFCARNADGGCAGRLTVEHTQGRVRQGEERWSIIYLCFRHHLGDLLDKNKNRHLAFQQATLEDFAKYPKSAEAWKLEKEYLTSIYGK